MELQSTLLFIVASINSILSLFVLVGRRNRTNIVYSIFVLFASLWSIGLGLFLVENDVHFALTIANFYYIFAAGIPLFFLYFSIIFSNDYLTIKKIYLYLLSLPFVFLIIFILLNKNFLIKDVFITSWGKDVIINKINYLFYLVYFVLYTLISYYKLIKSYISNINIGDFNKKKQLEFIIFGTIIGFSFGTIFDLFLPFIGNYKYIYLGPLFSFFMVFAIAYSVTKYNLFNTKVVTAQVIVITLCSALFARLLFSVDLKDFIVNIIFLTLSGFIGALLIKSVMSEVKQKEQVQALAQDLQKANDRLKELDQLKSEFLSLATHQIRAPLTAIKGYASLILEGDYGKVTSPVQSAVKNIFESCQSLVLIVSDFLDISRIEQGRMKYELSDFDIVYLTSDIVEKLRPNIESAGLSISMELPKENILVKLDQNKIRQVVGNIIDNSIKYTKSGSIKVSLEKEGSSALISVKDTGIGISKEDIPKLFAKFVRAKDASKTNVIGTGLGLYIAKQMVEAQGGNVWVESLGIGQGSTFFIRLPVKE